ncbi:membrane protein insertion efficiency factor YidD, partial [candidate division TA06 bacterium]
MVARLLTILVFLAFLSVSQTSQADISEDLSFIRKSNQIKPAKEERPPRSERHQVNELSLVFTSVIRLYQTLVSSQDVPACNFTKSCSRFGMDAL